MSLELSALFDPITINDVEIRNRFVMPAMQRGWGVDGQVSDRTAEYYGERARGGTGLIITESLGIDHPASSLDFGELHLTPHTRDGWKKCVDIVHAEGSRFLMQLWHCGAVRMEGQGKRPDVPPISPSGIFAGKPRGVAATADDLQELKDAWVSAAVMAIELGADGVELHMAHGYLLHQFLWQESNLRTDGYGGDDMANRVRFPAEVARAVRDAIGPGPILSCRISQWAEWDYAAKIARTPEELRILISTLEGAGVDLFNISTRYLYKPEWEDSPLPLAAWVKSMTSKPVVAVGSIGMNIDLMHTGYSDQVEEHPLVETLTDALERFERDEFDMLAVGRSIIGDASFVNKVREGRFTDVRPFTRRDLVDMLEQSEGHVPEEIRQRAQVAD